ncbi:hypothetical protein Sjap_007101 [Stephania japonica]|uniref:Uncharacterized protein n=1 Tax=Stephania japonica TaxID=461633 RepID=A0AAP0PA44_9MAGN
MADQPESSGGSLEDVQQRLDEMPQLVILHGYQLEVILRLLMTHTTVLSLTSAAPITQVDRMSRTSIDTNIKASIICRRSQVEYYVLQSDGFGTLRCLYVG